MSHLSETAKENLKKMKDWRETDVSTGGQFIKIPAGTSRTLLFDAEDMSTEVVEFEPNKPVKRARYGVYDVTERSTRKQYLTGGKNLSLAIDSNLEEGNITLKISRTGERFETRYSVVATQLPADYQNPMV